MDRRHNKNIGRTGEDMAAAYLAERGLRILEQRVRLKHGEIDIVGRDGDEWVFVEVKTRTSDIAGSAGEGMTESKLAHMKSAVAEYLNKNHIDEAPVRCDLLTIDFLPGGESRIEHFPGSIFFS